MLGEFANSSRFCDMCTQVEENRELKHKYLNVTKTDYPEGCRIQPGQEYSVYFKLCTPSREELENDNTALGELYRNRDKFKKYLRQVQYFCQVSSPFKFILAKKF